MIANMSKQLNSSTITEFPAISKRGYACMLFCIFSFICFLALAQNQTSEQLKIDVSVGDFYIDVSVGDSFYDIVVSELFEHLGVNIGDQPEAETGVKFDKGYIQTQLKDVKPGQRFTGFVKDAGKLEKTCGIEGVKNGNRVEIYCNEKGKFRLSFPGQTPRSNSVNEK